MQLLSLLNPLPDCRTCQGSSHAAPSHRAALTLFPAHLKSAQRQKRRRAVARVTQRLQHCSEPGQLLTSPPGPQLNPALGLKQRRLQPDLSQSVPVSFRTINLSLCALCPSLPSGKNAIYAPGKLRSFRACMNHSFLSWLVFWHRS